MKFSLVVLAEIALATEWNCYDNTNGGCSHYCSQATELCSCPACWELTEDGKTCQPEAAKITTTCSAEGMIVTVDDCVYNGGLSADSLITGYANSDGCIADFAGDTHTSTTALDGCGMSAAMSENQESITFSNTISVFDRTNTNTIIFMADVDINVSCTFSTSASVDTSTSVSEAETTSGANGSGDLAFQASFYQSFDDDLEATNLAVNVGDLVHLGIKAVTGNALFGFYIDSCVASDGTQTHPIIDDTCPDEFLVESTTDLLTAGTGRFDMTYQSFQFTNTEPDTDKEIDVSCTINVYVDAPENIGC